MGWLLLLVVGYLDVVGQLGASIRFLRHYGQLIQVLLSSRCCLLGCDLTNTNGLQRILLVLEIRDQGGSNLQERRAKKRFLLRGLVGRQLFVCRLFVVLWLIGSVFDLYKPW